MARYESLSYKEKKMISGWIGHQWCDFNLLYRASRDGCSPGAFHQKCDQKGLTVTVVYGTTGHVFGGYTSLSWRQDGGWVSDVQSFLFSLRNPNGIQLKKLCAKARSQIFTGNGYGSYFGSGNCLMVIGSGYNGGFGQDGVFTPGLVVNLELEVFERDTMTSLEFSGGSTDVFDIEVYEVKESQLLPEDQMWRKIDIGLDWTPGVLREAIKNHKVPEPLKAPHTRILLLGQSGSGKSSFFNTINSAFRGHVTSQAATGSGKHSVTTKFRTYKIRTEGGDSLNFRLCDVMGFEEDGGLILSDIPYILDGNIQDHFQFNPSSCVTPSHHDFQPGPKLKDKIHVASLVIDASTIQSLSSSIVDKMQSAVKMMVSRGIPCVILLTKVDKICFHVAEDVSKVFHSSTVCDMVETVSDLVGLPRFHVLPVKNYESEISTEESVDTLALLSLRQMLRFAEDFYNEQLDLLGD